MSASDRAPSSQFYWRDWLADPAVQSMSFDEQGRYLRVLAMTHQTDQPGVCSEEDIRRWACYEPEDWMAHREALARAFKIQPDGTWIQKRTVGERVAQRRRFKRSQTGGRASATRTRDSLGRLASRLDTHLEDGLGTPSSSSASSKLKNPTPPLPPLAAGIEAPARPQTEGTAGAGQATRTAERRVSGLEPVGDVLRRAMPKPGVEGEQSSIPGYSDGFVKRMHSRFPGIDLFAVGSWVSDEVRAGRVKDPEGLFFWRCQQLCEGGSRAECRPP